MLLMALVSIRFFSLQNSVQHLDQIVHILHWLYFHVLYSVDKRSLRAEQSIFYTFRIKSSGSDLGFTRV